MLRMIGIMHTNVIVGDSLNYHNYMTFTTRDQDNDQFGSGNCAIERKSAWWFKSCNTVNPNGQYADSERISSEYILWFHWKDSLMSLKTMQLMIRPRV